MALPVASEHPLPVADDALTGASASDNLIEHQPRGAHAPRRARARHERGDHGRHRRETLASRGHDERPRARDAFEPSARRGYLNTATVGLPPRPALDALQDHLTQWRAGRIDAARCDEDVRRSRDAFAQIVGARAAEDVAVGSQLSPFAGLVAASLRAGDEVLVPRGEFTSVLFPFLVQEARGVRIRAVALTDLLDAIDAGTRLVALSAVQSADGAVVDLDRLAAAARHHGARVFLDVTQCAGACAIDAARFDYVAASAYKWLLCPRGTAFMTVRPDAVEELVPHTANWYANDDPWSSIYDLPLRLGACARRFDVSPAWPCWAGAAPALELVHAWGVERTAAHDVALANRLRDGLGLPRVASAIVNVLADGADARLAAAGVRAATRAGGARLSFHAYNDEADVDRALDALADLEVAR